MSLDQSISDDADNDRRILRNHDDDDDEDGIVGQLWSTIVSKVNTFESIDSFVCYGLLSMLPLLIVSSWLSLYSRYVLFVLYVGLACPIEEHCICLDSLV
ncbi:hypothetical protein MtrunA17_Chr1g0193791 [Medicago truncatula]|uniref:Transmembrane protein n=1 Tax=Medicago truncatula TaxID=3880 RepID=A0A396JVY0_MEDTR|nr:hypothetical protein MtrunA17_Chr1g0193791 [Medicago truncatula]